MFEAPYGIEIKKQLNTYLSDSYTNQTFLQAYIVLYSCD